MSLAFIACPFPPLCVRACVRACCSGGGHDHFTSDPPLAEQIDRMITNLTPVAAAALKRGLTLGLLPHLDYRSTDLLQVMHAVNSPALAMAFDTTNSFPTA